ncbi:Hypothetical protein NTJ_12492 [Nesidiocoris tenuis]|uniref:Uncharacterized protein n=2 Tax=Nesidiocoris tenuis TaxID=355587 RepID=A0ABN7B8Z3_9HEMI|nr:Hypothetical protein NTJ_12492 [Nesidiocoris tenuis]
MLVFLDKPLLKLNKATYRVNSRSTVHVCALSRISERSPLDAIPITKVMALSYFQSTQLEQKGSLPSMLNDLITEKTDTNVQAIRGFAARSSTAPNAKGLVKLKKYRHDSSLDRRKHSFKRFESCYRQLYPCRRIKTFRSHAISRNLKDADDRPQLSDFQRSQSMPNFQWPPLYKCKRRIQESRMGINLDRHANRELPSFLLPLYECKAKRSEPIGGNHPLRYSGIALHKKIEIKECMRQIKLQQIYLNQELTEKWSTYYDSPGKKPRNKRDYSSAKILMAVDELKRKIGKMHERNKIFRQTPFPQTAAQSTKRIPDETRTSLLSKELHNSSQLEVDENIKAIKLLSDQDIAQSSKKLSTEVEDSSSHECTSCTQKPMTSVHMPSSKSGKDVEQHGKEIHDVNSVLDKREPKKAAQRNRNDLRADATLNLKEEKKVDSNFDPTILKERIRQWKLGTDKEKDNDPAGGPSGSKTKCPFHSRENASAKKGETNHQKQSIGIEEDPLISYKPFIVCKTANKAGKRSLSSLPTFRVIPNKASSKGPFVVIKRNFSGIPKNFRVKGNWFNVIKLHRRDDKLKNSAADEETTVADKQQTDAPEPITIPGEVASENRPSAGEVAVPQTVALSSAKFQKKLAVDMERKLKKAKASVNNKPWPKDSRIGPTSVKEHHLQGSTSLPIINDQHEQVSGYQWVSTNKDILEEIKHEKQLLNCRRLVPGHVKASIQEFKLPLKAQIADYRKRNESKKVYGSSYNRSMYRRYSTGKSRAQFFTNFPSKSEILSFNNAFSVDARFLSTSTIAYASASSRNPPNQSKSDPEILISSDFYKQYVLRPIYGENSKNERKSEKTPCEFSSWPIATAGSRGQRPKHELTSPSMPHRFSSASPPRSLKKQVEELKCLIEKNKISSHVAKATSFSKLSKHNENYHQRLTRLVRAAEETAKNMEIPEPKQTSRVEVTNKSSLRGPEGSSSPQQVDFNERSSSAISSQEPNRKQPFLNLVQKLKSVVDFVGGKALLPTRISGKQPSQNENPEEKNGFRVPAGDLRMSGMSTKLNGNTRISSGPTKEEIALLQRTLSELNISDKKPLKENDENVHRTDRSSSHEKIVEKTNDSAAHVLNNVQKSMSTPAMAVPQANPSLEGQVPPKPNVPQTSPTSPSSSRNSKEYTQPISSSPRSAAVSNVRSSIDASAAGNPKTGYKAEAEPSRNASKMPTDSQSVENPYRRTSPSKFDDPAPPIARGSEYDRIKNPNPLPSVKSIPDNQSVSNRVDEIYPDVDKNSSKIPSSSNNHSKTSEDNPMKPKVELKQTQDLANMPVTNPMAKNPAGLQDLTNGASNIQSEGNKAGPTQTADSLNSQAAVSPQIPGDQILKRDESVHHPQVKDSSQQNTSNMQHQPSTGYGEVKQNFGHVPHQNLAQEQEVRYFPEGVQYTYCPDCGRIYPIYCACATFQNVTPPKVKVETGSPSFLARYFQDERETVNSILESTDNSTSFSQRFTRHRIPSDVGRKTGQNDGSSKTVDNFENRAGNSYGGTTYVRQGGPYGEILEKEPFINPDVLKKLKLPVNLGEELKETTWYNATDPFPRQ